MEERAPDAFFFFAFVSMLLVKLRMRGRAKQCRLAPRAKTWYDTQKNESCYVLEIYSSLGLLSRSRVGPLV